MKLKALLTTVMFLLSILVLGLGLIRKNVLWMWIGFICFLISGIFLQLFIDRKRNMDVSGRKPEDTPH
jgi:ABC-type multidrug transport system permease subunit